MSIIEKEGKTVEQAIERGLKEMGLSRDEIQVEIVSLGSSGFLGVLGAKPAKVRLKVQAQPRVRRIVETILDKMGFPGSVRSFVEEGGRLTAVIESDAGEKHLQANNGAALDALEYLVGKIYHEAEQDIHLDIGGFRQSQGDHLKTMALDLARKVKETGQEQKLHPMPPHQRKIIHKALENNPDVRTFAVGEGDRRRVIIAPRHGSGQAPHHGSGQAPRHAAGHEPATGQAQRPGQVPKFPKAQPEPKAKAGGKPGKRDGGRKHQGGKPPRPQERQEAPPRSAQAQGARTAPRPAPRPAPPPSEPVPETGEQGAGFVPRSRKKSRRP